MALRLITAPTALPISVAEVKARLRVEHTADDTAIEAYINASRLIIEGANGHLGRALCEQTWELLLDEFPEPGCSPNRGAIRVPLPPLISVTSVKYLDADLDEQTLAAESYSVDAVSEPGWILPGVAGWPITGEAINAVTVRFVCGYEAAGSPAVQTVPEPIRQAIALDVKLYLDDPPPDARKAIENARDALLSPYRIPFLA